ncbi:MAG: site-2 protease family protein [Planctomycetes bacterium]|nr:site-2 protease family protein [Planctomycetota bacterium]
MEHSIFVGRVFGIPIRLHVVFLLLFAVLAAQTYATDGGAAAAQFAMQFSLVFLFVLLHELGHCVVAQSFGIHVLDITLWPLGGLARLSTFPRSARVEFAVAVAGPAVNFALAVLCLLLERALPQLSEWLDFAFWINCVMGGFNLIPAFPLDGGRVFRAALARELDWLAATRVAVRVARGLAIVLFLAGIAAPGAFSLVLIAAFVFVSAGSELRAAEAREYDRLARDFDAYATLGRFEEPRPPRS